MKTKIISILTTISLLVSITQAHIPSPKVQGNTDLTGAKIVSTQPSTLTTGTLTYSDLENKTEYSNIGFGSSGLDSPMAGDKQTETNTAISNTITVDIKDKTKQTQDISKISNDTQHAHYRVQEVNKELLNIHKDVAGQVGAAAFTYVAHTLYENDNIKDSLPPKTLVHGIIGGVVSKIAGGEFKTGATGAVVAHETAKMVKEALKERYINGEITKKQLDTAMDISSVLANTIVASISNSSKTSAINSVDVGLNVVQNNDKKDEALEKAKKKREQGYDVAVAHVTPGVDGYFVMDSQSAAKMAQKGIPQTQEQTDRINQGYKDGIATGLRETSLLCVTGAMICANTPGFQPYVVPFAGLGVFSDGLLYLLKEKTSASIARDGMIDIISPPGMKGKLFGMGLKGTIDYMENKNNNKDKSNGM